MRSILLAALPTILALPILACGSNTPSGNGAGGGGGGGSGGASGGSTTAGGNGGGAVACKGTQVTADAANNYTFASTLSFPPIKVQPKANLTFDWSAATADLIGHTIDPKADINTVLIFEWNLSLDQVQSKLNRDDLASTDLTAQPPLSLTTNGKDTTAKLLDFGLNGSRIGADGGLVTVEQVMLYFDPDIYDPANHTFTLMAATGSTLGQGTRMIQSFILDKSSTETKVTMTKDSTKLDYTASLHDLTPTGIPGGTAGVTLDWRKMTTNALGNEFDTTAITRAILAHYSQSADELEKKFLDLELIASDLYQGKIESGTKVDFSKLTTSSGKSFSGIDGTGTWIVALQCGSCRNPAPWYLTILKPCS